MPVDTPLHKACNNGDIKDIMKVVGLLVLVLVGMSATVGEPLGIGVNVSVGGAGDGEMVWPKERAQGALEGRHTGGGRGRADYGKKVKLPNRSPSCNVLKRERQYRGASNE